MTIDRSHCRRGEPERIEDRGEAIQKCGWDAHSIRKAVHEHREFVNQPNPPLSNHHLLPLAPPPLRAPIPRPFTHPDDSALVARRNVRLGRSDDPCRADHGHATRRGDFLLSPYILMTYGYRIKSIQGWDIPIICYYPMDYRIVQKASGR